MHRFTSFAIVLTLSALGAAQAPAGPSAAQPLTVHEWGTFTSVAGQDGTAVEWLPLSAPPDLPCFVERVRFNIKGSLAGKVRMETPVLYFYTPRDMTVNVHVGFRQGVVTEWFPHASVTPTTVDRDTLRRSDAAGTITWTDVRVMPVGKATLPLDGSRSHYYMARQTDASVLRVGSGDEKFLFYRGVGGFEPPVAATVARDGSIVVSNPGGEAIGDVILFENRGGTMTYQVRHADGGRITLGPLVLEGEFVPPQAELEQILTAQGLYPKEANAMIDTWRDSWFEEGTRLFYIVPRRAIDAILPLDINPVPSSVARVFVGRVELVTPATERAVAAAIAGKDHAALARYGRFLQPIANRLMTERTPSERAGIEAVLQAFRAASAQPTAPACR